MKKVLFVICLLTFITACVKSEKINVVASDSTKVSDSMVVDSVKVDSVKVDSTK